MWMRHLGQAVTSLDAPTPEASAILSSCQSLVCEPQLMKEELPQQAATSLERGMSSSLPTDEMTRRGGS